MEVSAITANHMESCLFEGCKVSASPFLGRVPACGCGRLRQLCWPGTHTVGGGDVSPGIKRHMSTLSPFLGEKGRLRQLCWPGTHTVGGGDVSPGIKRHMSTLSPFLGEKGRLRQLCWPGTHTVGGGDVSPGIKRHMSTLSPFLGEKGRLRQLCWWRGRREPLKIEGVYV